MSQRLQPYFRDDQYKELKQLSRKRHSPVAVLVREAVDHFLEGGHAVADLASDPLMGIVAIASDPDGRSNLAEDHDTILYPRRK